MEKSSQSEIMNTQERQVSTKSKTIKKVQNLNIKRRKARIFTTSEMMNIQFSMLRVECSQNSEQNDIDNSYDSVNNCFNMAPTKPVLTIRRQNKLKFQNKKGQKKVLKPSIIKDFDSHNSEV